MNEVAEKMEEKETQQDLDFGEDKQTSSADFVIQFPTADKTNAIIRIG